MKVPGRSQILHIKQVFAKGKNMVLFTCFHMEEDYFKKGNQYDQGSGGKFSWQKLKQMLSCFEFFPVAFLARWGKRN